jgi:Undecaprenyl-phosphate glucose phosphotransferase
MPPAIRCIRLKNGIQLFVWDKIALGTEPEGAIRAGTRLMESPDTSVASLAVHPRPGMVVDGVPSAGRWRFAADVRAAFQACLAATDALTVAVTGIASYLIRERTPHLPAQYWGHIIVGCVVFALVMQIFGMYRFAALRRRHQHLARLGSIWGVVVLMLIAIIFLTHRAQDYSRAWMLLWALGGWLGLVASRLRAWHVIRRRRSQLVTRVAVVGEPSAARCCAQRLKADGNGDVDVIGVYLLGARGARLGGDNGVLAQLLRADTRVDEIVFAMRCGEIPDLYEEVIRFSPRVVDIKIGFDLAASGSGFERPLVLVPVWNRPLAGAQAVVKRAIDLCASAILLVCILPLMAVVAALIKLDSPGPVLFKQQRFGINKKPFELYKFRSMCCEASSDPSVPQARRRDPRVTRIGRFLRRTSLDELPQLVNVFKGDMSLVGPRPHAIQHDDKYASLIEGYLTRHHVKPGITGWAQVHGWRGETDTLEKMERRIEYDIFYINHWSLLLDLRILFRTFVVVLRQRNAY